MGRRLEKGIQRKAAARTIVAPVGSATQPKWLLGLLLAAITIIAYQHAWHAGYVWDDDIYVTKNKLLTAPDGLRRIWFSFDSPSQYFPLVYTSFRLEHALWGLSASGYHWVNILLHVGNALLVWRLLTKLGIPGAWLAAALFALHPVQVESVAWITERKNVLMGLFFLLALLSWVRFVETSRNPQWRHYFLALLLYQLALFSKTTACTLPAALFLVLWMKETRITWRWMGRIAPFVVLGIGMGLLAIWWERYIQGTHGEFFRIGLAERILVANRAVWFYAGKLLWPVNLVFSYPRWTISISNPFDYAWLAGTGAAAAAIFLLRRRLGRGPEVAALFFVATLSPVLGFIMLYTFRFSFVADHYQYLASIGPLALAAAGITRLAQAFDQRLLRDAFCGVLLAVLGVLTWKQCGIYADEDTLWRATISKNPGSWMAHNNLGISLEHQERTEEAMAHYRQALDLNGRYEEAHHNLGNLLLRVGQGDEAIVHFQSAVQTNPRNVRAQYNLALALVQAGRVREGIVQYDKVREIDSRYATAHDNLGTTLAQLGKVDEAISEYLKILETDPGNAGAHYNLSGVLLQAGRLDEARDHLKMALKLQPKNVVTRTKLERLLRQTGPEPEARTREN